MYHHHFERYKNKKIQEYPELKKEIAEIYTDAVSHNQAGSFWYSIAHEKVKKLIAKHESSKKFRFKKIVDLLFNKTEK